MVKSIIFLYIISLVICLEEDLSHYTLIFNETFNSFETLEKNWDLEIGTGENGWGNNEKQYYRTSAENIYIEDNQLHIKAINTKFQNNEYTSARLTTKNTFQFAYGYVKTRMKLPKAKGIWPAFWMLGKDIEKVGWPNCGEIDIIETVNDNDIIMSYLHWFDDGTNNRGDYGSENEILNKDEFHIYELFWDKDYIRIFIDDIQTYIIDIAKIHTNAFTKQFYFILNMAVGGDFPGDDIDNSKFPLEMVVDYIEVYQKNDEFNYQFTPKLLIYDPKIAEETLNPEKGFYFNPFFKYGELRINVSIHSIKGFTSKIYLFNREKYYIKGNSIYVRNGQYPEMAVITTKDDSNKIISGVKWNGGDYYKESKEIDVSKFNEYIMIWNEKYITIYANDYEIYKIDISTLADFHKYYMLFMFIEKNGQKASNNNENSPEMILQRVKLYQYVNDTCEFLGHEYKFIINKWLLILLFIIIY